MPSQVGGDLSRIESGPCEVTYKGIEVGHTMGGVTFSVKPQLRERKVDEYGEHIVDLIYQGDQVECKTTLAEKTLAVVQTVYQMSYTALSDTQIGIGNLPGGKGSDKAGRLTLHPLDGYETEDDVVFFMAVVKDVGDVQFGTITADRVFEVTWGMLIDESQEDGQLIGTIGVSGQST